MLEAFGAGMGIGLAAAAPLGPVNMVVLRLALARGWRPAIVAGLGAAVGDALFAAVAAFGLAQAADWAREHAAVLRLLGGAAMLLFALALWRQRSPPTVGATPAAGTRVAAMVLAMTLTNPATLLFFLSAVAAAGAHGSGGREAGAAWLVAGAFAGSMLWWGLLCAAARRLRGRLARRLGLINAATAAGLALFGLAALAMGARAAGWI